MKKMVKHRNHLMNILIFMIGNVCNNKRRIDFDKKNSRVAEIHLHQILQRFSRRLGKYPPNLEELRRSRKQRKLSMANGRLFQ